VAVSSGIRYDKSFYEGQSSGSARSAERIVPVILEIMSVQSVIDIGGGVGPWARAFHDLGVPRAVCVDGSYVDPDLLLIPESDFIARDLTAPLDVTERFDLAVSLEVAEHLPPACGEAFVAELVKLAPAILFSAAIPFQGGVDHLNEQWQSYWARLFADRGYRLLDVVRPRVWDDHDVEPWYAQNTFLYVSADHPIEVMLSSGNTWPIDLVSPQFYRYQRQFIERPPVREAADTLASSVRRWSSRTVRRTLSQHLARFPRPFPR
jgi:hypothetical protein